MSDLVEKKPRFKPARDVARTCLAEWNLRDLFWDAATTADTNATKYRNKAAHIRFVNQPAEKEAMHTAGILERRARAFQIRAELLRVLSEQVSADVEPNPKRGVL